MLGHIEAFAWIDDWIDLSMDDLRQWEREMQSETNKKVVGTNPTTPTTPLWGSLTPAKRTRTPLRLATRTLPPSAILPVALVNSCSRVKVNTQVLGW